MRLPMSNKFAAFCVISLFCIAGCTKARTSDSNSTAKPETTPVKTENTLPPEVEKIQNPGKVIHVIVALCDNEHQGIVPVPAFLGNGEDPAKNLYWGASFGVKTFFSKSANWQKLADIPNPSENILERVVFKHKTQNVYLVADAYRGSKMKSAIDDFFAATAGAKRENVRFDNEILQILGSANLVAFVGHNGLMDFKLQNQPPRKDDEKREAIILACASRNYFAAPLKNTSAQPLLWTSNLMAPEAYILHDALEGWVNAETDEQVRLRASKAYSKYQKISVKSAQNLLVTGW